MLMSAIIASSLSPEAPAIRTPVLPAAVAPAERQMSAQLITWAPGEVRCKATLVKSSMVRRPWSSLSFGGAVPAPVTFRFSIDATGRPLSIVRNGERFIPFGEDLGPAFATSRFSAGHALSDCSITYSAAAHPLSEAPVEDLVSYTITPIGPRLPQEGWDRIAAGGSCWKRPFPQPLIRAIPDFRRIEGTPGVKDWSLIGYDTDKNGTPRNVHMVDGTGNGALTRAAEQAVANSRFTGENRTGCLYPYWKSPATLAPPPAPEERAFKSEDSNCPVRTKWKKPLATRFPEAWRRRSIEGWAVLTYDLAPWGVAGNIKVVAAEPAEDFGWQAQMIVQNASAESSPTGATGCVETVHFMMSRDDEPAAEDGMARPLY